MQVECVDDALSKVTVVGEHIAGSGIRSSLLDPPCPSVKLIIAVQVVVPMAGRWMIPPRRSVPSVKAVVSNVRCDDITLSRKVREGR